MATEPLPALDLPPIIVTPSVDTSISTGHQHQHSHRRFFVGPLPEKVVSQTETQIRKKKKRLGFLRASDEPPHDDDGEDDGMSQIIKDHAFSFFIREGGNVDEWGEHTEESVRKEMLRKWKESEWGRIWRRRDSKDIRQTSRWVGGSFEIGSFLGVNVLNEESPESLMERLSTRNSESTSTRTTKKPSPSTAAEETFVTAHSEPPETPSSPPQTPTAPKFPSIEEEIHDASSSTGLLRPSPPPRASSGKARTEIIHRPIFKASTSGVAKSDGHVGFITPPSPVKSSKSKGMRRSVRYEDEPAPELPAPSAPPGEVLQRTGSAVEATSAGVTEDALPQANGEIQWGDVVMRDRMLVRVNYTKSESLGSSFDEAQHRTTSHLHYEDWAEFMVVWRKDRLEIYEDFSLPCKEWYTGHKHLAFLIPLKAPTTRLSLYSFVDLTFCLTSPPTSVHLNESKARSIFRREKEGTNIFVFKPKSRTRALDWTWQLWRQLDGQIPSSIEVRSPELNARVRIDIPSSAITLTERGYTMFSRENVIELCKASLHSIQDWEEVVERRMREGKTLELAWRMETKLDWVWQEEDVDGKKREWAVLCGLALKQPGKSSRLEIHLKEHFPATVHLTDDTRLHEPPAIEGYLNRIKPNTQTKQAVYLASHDGNLFSLTPAHAHPPSPPGLHPPPSQGDASDYTATLRTSEVRRGGRQIMEANGVSDFRSILAVRRAFQLVPPSSHEEEGDGEGDIGVGAPPEQDGNGGFEAWTQAERAGSDDEDEGGDEGMAKSKDKPQLRMMRSFELLLTTGHVIRFEAYSRRVALEWIGRLRALVFYWKHRHRNDASEEMDLAKVGSRRPPLTPPTRAHAHCEGEELPPDPPPDPEAFLPALGSLYNWCVLEGCKPILKGGKVFMRRGLHGQYKLVELFLVAGHLIQYQISPDSSLHQRRSKIINLVDAYVCSGYFAALTLPEGQYDPTAPIVPRRYQDGLEADDREEDMLFMIWYRPHPPFYDENKDKDGATTDGANTTIPPLSAKRKIVVFKTRSKLERDVWCWALNSEIEKIVRDRRDREEKLRQTGGLVKL